jgi:hypothetical protein
MNHGEKWELAIPVGFPLEKTLHDLVADAPQVLPLAGEPRIVILGREVPCGSGYADLLAVEPGGRLVLVEVKLVANGEARRAVVAQILAYAAALKGLDTTALDRLLAKHLPKGCESVSDVVEASGQDGTFDRDDFTAGLSDSLATGRFRLVLVLDSTPADLVRLVGYLESMTDSGLIIDLVTVSQYVNGESRMLIPQRIDPERTAESHLPTKATSGVPKAVSSEGTEVFEASIVESAAEDRELLEELVTWAKSLKERDLARLFSTQGTSGLTTLIPQLRAQGAGLITIANQNGPVLWFWRSVFEKLVPSLIPEIEATIGTNLGQGTAVRKIGGDLLALITSAYELATEG